MADGTDQGGLIYKVENQVSGLDQLKEYRQVLQGVRADLKALKDVGIARTPSIKTDGSGINAFREGVNAAKKANQEARREREADIRATGEALKRKIALEKEASRESVSAVQAASRKKIAIAEAEEEAILTAKRNRLAAEARLVQQAASLQAVEAKRQADIAKQQADQFADAQKKVNADIKAGSRKLRDDLKAMFRDAKNDLRDLKALQINREGDPVGEFTSNAQAGLQAQKDAYAEIRAELRRLAKERDNDAKAAERQAKAAARAVEQEKRLTDQLNRRVSQAVANGLNLNTATPGQAVKAGLASALPTADPKAFTDQEPTIRKRITDWLGLTEAQDKAESSAKNLFFTFRRLFGVLALFTIIREVTRGVITFVKQMVTLNSALEQSRIGIAALLITAGAVSNAMGESAEGATALAIAGRTASKQIEQLRKDAIETNTSFQDLVETFQVALAPGLRSGLNVDEIRQFTVRIAQAARAIGLQQNQLAEEVRSILSGTIQSRTTRIAVALGITNEDIRQAKAAGNLLQFLEKRFAGISVAGEQASKTFDGLFNKFKTGLDLAIQGGGVEFFETIKSLLDDVGNLVVTKDAEIIKINPALLAFIREIANGLSIAVQNAKAMVSALNNNDVTQIGIFISQSIQLISTALVGIITGVIKGFTDVAVVLNYVLKLMNLIFGNQTAGTLLVTLVRAVTVLKLSTTILGLIPGMQGIIIKNVNRIITLLTIVNGQKVGILGLLRGLISGTIAWNATLGSVAATIALILVEILAIFAIMDKLQKSEKTGGFFKGAGELLTILIGQDELQNKINDQIEQRIRLKNSLAQAEARGDQKNAERLRSFIEQTKVEQDRLTKQREAIRNGVTEKSVMDELKAVISSINLSDFLPKLPGVTENTRTLVEEFGDLPGIIRNSNDEMSGTAEAVAKFRDDLAKAKGELQGVLDNLNIAGPVQAMNNAITASVEEARKESEALALRNTELINQLERAQQDLKNITGNAIPSLSQGDQQKAAALKKAAEDRLKIDTSILKIQDAIRTAELDVKTAKARFNDAERIAAEDRLAQLKNEEAAKKASLIADVTSFNSLLNGADQRQRIIDLVKQQILLEGTAVAIAEETDKLGQVKIDNAQRRIRLLDIEIQKAAQLANEELRRNLPAQQIDAREAVSINNLGPFARQEQVDLIQSNAEIERRLVLLSQEKALRDDSLNRLDVMIQQMTAQKFSQEAILAVEQQRFLLSEQFNASITKQTAEVQKQQVERDKQATRAATGAAAIGAQARLSIDEMVANLPSQFEQINLIIGEAVSGFASFISSSIADAFDPNNDKSIKERFASFLADLGKMILDLVIRIQIVKAVALAFSGGGEVPAVGYNRGGAVRSPFEQARGYASGGATYNFRRPSGLHPSDTVPIWAAPGEWIVRAKSALMYGRDVMSKINAGLIDPLRLRALANTSAGAVASMHQARTPGYAMGGQINAPAPQSSHTSGGGLAVLPVLVADRQQAEKLYSTNNDAELVEAMDRIQSKVKKRWGIR